MKCLLIYLLRVRVWILENSRFLISFADCYGQLDKSEFMEKTLGSEFYGLNNVFYNFVPWFGLLRVWTTFHPLWTARHKLYSNFRCTYMLSLATLTNYLRLKVIMSFTLRVYQCCMLFKVMLLLKVTVFQIVLKNPMSPRKERNTTAKTIRKVCNGGWKEAKERRDTTFPTVKIQLENFLSRIRVR